MKLPSLDSIFRSFTVSLYRFPLATLFSIGACVTSMYLIEYETAPSNTFAFKLLTTLLIGVPLMIGLQNSGEQYAENPSRRWLLYVSGLFLVVLYFFIIAPDLNMIEMVRPIRFLSLWIIAHLFVSVSPYVKGGLISDFWEYNKNIFVIWLTGAMYGILIFSGLSVAILAVDQLFGVNIDPKTYAHVFVIVASVFHPLFFMSNHPDKFHLINQDEYFVKLILNLVKYILIPLSMLYIAILYLYGIKILIDWSLPKGWVSSLVIGFSIVGILSYLLNYRLPESESGSTHSWYKKWFFYILSPLVVLLYIAIFKRLNDYGFTPERYFVLLTGLWLSFISIYFILSRKDNIKWIPVSLIIFLLTGTYSPIDAFHISGRSQFKRLTSIFNKHKLLQDGKLVSDASGVLNNSEQQTAASIVNLMHEINAIDIINQNLASPVSQDSLHEKDGAALLMKSLGIENSKNTNNQGNILNFYADNYRPTRIEGYSEMLKIDVYKGDKKENGVELSTDGYNLIWKEKNAVLAELDLKDKLKLFVDKYGKSADNIDPNKLTFDFEDQNYSLKVCVQQLGIENIRNEYRIHNLDGYMIYSKK